MKRHGPFLALVWIVLLAALGIWAASARNIPTRAAPGADAAVVRVAGMPPAHTVAPGRPISIVLEVAGAVDLGAATLRLGYDPAVVQVIDCAPLAAAPFDTGSCNPTYAQGVARFTLIAANGITGSHGLFAVTFLAIGPDGAATDLSLTVDHFADTTGTPLPVSTLDGTLSVAGPPAAVAATLHVTPAVTTLVPGQSVVVSVTLTVTGAHPLAAATILMRYDPQVVRPVQCVRSFAPPLSGGCNLNYDPAQGLIAFNALSSDGVTGVIPLYTITFEAAATAAAMESSTLIPIVQTLIDVHEDAMIWQAAGSQITVTAGPANAARLTVGEPDASGVFTASQGMTNSLSIWMADVVDLGAATLVLRYDPAVVRPLGCTVHTGAPGVDGGGCTIGDGQVRVNIVSSQGISGTAPLFNVTFTPQPGATAGITSPLTLVVLNFANADADPLPARVHHGVLEVAPGDPAGLPLVRIGDGSTHGAFDLPINGQIAMTVSIQGVANLGAASIEIGFDPAVVRLISCAQIGPFDGGSCQAGADAAQLSLIAAGGCCAIDAQGYTAVGTLIFRAAGGSAVGESTPLSLTVTNFAEPDGTPLLYRVETSSLVLTEAAAVPIQVEFRPGQDLYQVLAGQTFTVPIHMNALPEQTSLGVSTVSLRLLFDPAVVQPVACALNTDAGKNGFEGGGCNANDEGRQSRFTALSTTGVTGETVLGQVVLVAVGPAGAVSPLTLAVDDLVDTSGQILSHAGAASQVEILGEGTPTATPTITGTRPTPTATPTPTITGTRPTPTATPTPTITGTRPTPTATATPTITGTRPTPTPTATPTITGTRPTPTATPTITGTRPTPTATPTITGTRPTPTATPTITGTRPTPTATPTITGTRPTPTATPTITGTRPTPTTTTTPSGQRRAYLPQIARYGTTERHLHLPLVVRQPPVSTLPDLVITELLLTQDGVQVVIQNLGIEPVTEAFWVDLYIDPHPPPTAVNQTWNMVGGMGAVWGVEGAVLPILPGNVVLLEMGDELYWAEYSNVPSVLPAGVPIYAQVDSANAETDYGGVFESHEWLGGVYNNITGPVWVQEAQRYEGLLSAGETDVNVQPNRQHLPARP